jgi:Cns1/TTC4 Wheel domain
MPDVHEDRPIGEYVEEMLPEPRPGTAPKHWDVHGEFFASNLNICASTYRKRLLKIGKKMTLRDSFAQGATAAGKDVERDGFMLVDGLLSLAVLVKGSAEGKEWIDNFRKDRERNATHS